jgi:hypothetical protein
MQDGSALSVGARIHFSVQSNLNIHPFIHLLIQGSEIK